jgi:small-conductance mechanosensitive channel
MEEAMVSLLLNASVKSIRAVVTIAVLTLPLGAAGAALSPPQPPNATIETAPVVIDGATLFRLRGISSLPAKQRADGVSERIRAIARDHTIPVSELRVVDRDDRSNIVAGERTIVSVFDADAQTEQVGRRDRLAEFYQTRIASAIERYRHERSATYLRNQGLHAVIVVGLLIGLLTGLRWLFRHMEEAAGGRLQARLKKLEAESYQLLTAEQIGNTWQSGLRAIHFLIGFVLVVVCLDYALSLFPWTRPVAQIAVQLIVQPLRTMGNGFVNALPGLIFIAILIFITRYVLGLTQLFFGGIASGRIRPRRFDQEWAWPTYRLVRFAFIGFALVMAYPYIPGSDSEAFKGISIFLGLLMSLGAASMVANSLAGYTLIYRRAFKVGDRIQIGDVIGDVVSMRQQVVHVRTQKNEEITIPSSVILSSHVINYSSLARERGLILHSTVGIGYETPWRQVEALLLQAAARTPELLSDPPPFVLQKQLGDFCVTYEINAYCDRPQQMERLYTALHQNILDVFNEHGVQIMTPAYEADPAAPKIVPKEDWYLAPAKQEK